jgi:[protein-PII] uridylyltransferase
VWDGWKTEVVTDLFHRTMQHLAGESPETTIDDLLAQRRTAVRTFLEAQKDEPWFAEHLDALPAAYLHVTSPQQAAADLRLLHGLSPFPSNLPSSPGAARGEGPSAVSVAAQHQPETDTIQFTIATSERVTPGIFHKLTGALTSHGLEIRTAQIHTLPDGLVLDRFLVHDPDYAGQPRPERLEQVTRSLVESLTHPSGGPPAFRRTWQMGGHRPVRVSGVPTRVNIDNSTSEQFTIIDIFTHDRTGLLYAITRELFELGLSVGRAKIGTFLDQVVDVFYVTDQQDRKIRDDRRLEEIRRRLLEVVEREDSAGR